MHKFIVNLTSEDTALIENAKLECFVVDTAQNKVKELIEAVRKQDKLVLVVGENACEVCNKYNADGVLIDLSKSEHCAKDVNFARKQIGDKVLGVISRNRRHEAMLISECEPDFVAFKVWNQGIEQVKELVSWYNEMFLIQSAVVLQEKIENTEDFDCDIIILSAEEYKKVSK
jgi:hypothetical protein